MVFLWMLILREKMCPRDYEALETELKMPFAAFATVSELPTLDSYKHGVVLKPVHEWLARLGANDLRVLEGCKNLLITEVLGHQPSTKTNLQRLIPAHPHSSHKIWDGIVIEHCPPNVDSPQNPDSIDELCCGTV